MAQAATASLHGAKFWDRGMLVAALVECGGDPRRAAAQLRPPPPPPPGGGLAGAQGGAGAGAEAYRAEMRFVAASTGLESLFAELAAAVKRAAPAAP